MGTCLQHWSRDPSYLLAQQFVSGKLVLVLWKHWLRGSVLEREKCTDSRTDFRACFISMSYPGRGLVCSLRNMHLPERFPIRGCTYLPPPDSGAGV